MHGCLLISTNIQRISNWRIERYWVKYGLWICVEVSMVNCTIGK